MTTFDDLPVELQGCCARLLDTSVGGPLWPGEQGVLAAIVERQLARGSGECGARSRAAPFEKSKHGT